MFQALAFGRSDSNFALFHETEYLLFVLKCNAVVTFEPKNETIRCDYLNWS